MPLDKLSELSLTSGSTTINLVLVRDQFGQKLFKRKLGPKFGQRFATETDLSYAVAPLEDEFVKSETTWHHGFGHVKGDKGSQESGRYHVTDGVDCSLVGVMIPGPDALADTPISGAYDLAVNYTGGVLLLARTQIAAYLTSDGASTYLSRGTPTAAPTSVVVHDNLLYISYGASTAYEYSKAPGTFGDTTWANNVVVSTRTGNDKFAALFAVTQDYSTGQQLLWKASNPSSLQYASSGINGSQDWSTEEIVGNSGAGTGADTFTSLVPFSDGLLIGKTDTLYFRDRDANIFPIAGPFRVGATVNFRLGTVHPGTGRAYFRVEDNGILEVQRNGDGSFLLSRKDLPIYGPEVDYIYIRGTITALSADLNYLHVATYDPGADKSYFFKGRYYTEDDGSWAWHGSWIASVANQVTLLYPFTYLGDPLFVTARDSGNTQRYYNHFNPLNSSVNKFITGGTFVGTFHDLGMVDVQKLAGRVRLETSGMISTKTVKVYYKLDTGTSTLLATISADASADTDDKLMPINSSFRRWRTELVYANTSVLTAAKVWGIIIKGVVRPRRRIEWDFIAKLTDSSYNLSGGSAMTSMSSVFLQLFNTASLAGAIYSSSSLTLTENLLTGLIYSVDVKEAEIINVMDGQSKLSEMALHLMLTEVIGSTS
mgnify:CR=1 FL=1